jgi:hypothetical protein
MTSKVSEIYENHEIECFIEINGISYNLKCIVLEDIRPKINKYNKHFSVRQYNIISQIDGSSLSKNYFNPSDSAQGNTIEEAIDRFLTRVKDIIPNHIDEV